MEDMEKLVGADGVKELKDFAEGTRELQSEITRFLTKLSADVAKLFSGTGGGRVTGASRSNLLRDALSSDNTEIQRLLEERGNTRNRNKRDDINDQINALMQEDKENKNNLDIEKLRAEQYKQIT